MSPTQRTLAALRADGWTVAVCERWNPYGRVRVDLFGFMDVLAYRPGDPVLAVQATSGPNVSSRVTKLRELATVATWLRSGCRLEVWGWRKAGSRGKRKTWQVRRVLLGFCDGRVVDAELDAPTT